MQRAAHCNRVYECATHGALHGHENAASATVVKGPYVSKTCCRLTKLTWRGHSLQLERLNLRIVVAPELDSKIWSNFTQYGTDEATKTTRKQAVMHLKCCLAVQRDNSQN